MLRVRGAGLFDLLSMSDVLGVEMFVNEDTVLAPLDDLAAELFATLL